MPGRRSTNQDGAYKRILGFWGRTAPALAVLTIPTWAATISIIVPGQADVWLAGQPNGSTVGGDTVPTDSPVLGSGGLKLTAGEILTFSATGSTSFFGSVGGSGGASSPDGIRSFGTVPANSLSGFTGPADALIGVFIGSGLPTGAAPAGLDFSTMAAQSAGTISPLLQQVFFIGDGLTGTGSGSAQQFTIPSGAERLFLGSADTVGNNFNNSGSFTVNVSDKVPASTAPEPGTALLLIISAVLLPILRPRLSQGRNTLRLRELVPSKTCRSVVITCLAVILSGPHAPGQTLKDRLKKKAEEMMDNGRTSTQSKKPSYSSSATGMYPPDGSSQTAGYPPNRSAKDLNGKLIIPDVVSADGTNYYTMATYRIDLFAIHKNPELISDEFLNAFATSQIATEQNLWNSWYKGSRGAPKTPYYTPQTWEWQTLVDEQPDFAKGALLDTFLFPQVEWPFVKNTPSLSETGVVAFLFSRSKIDGRDQSFAARELEPIVKKQLLLASERAPHAVWIPLNLPSWDWDPNTNSVRFLKGNPETPFLDVVTILEPQLPNPETKGVPHSPAYPSLYVEPLNTAPQHPQEIKPGVGSATASWREDAFARANGRARFPSFGILALDHKVEIRDIKIPVSQAEQLHQARTKFTARLLLEMEDIGIAPKAAMNNFDSLCVYAKVRKIEIMGSDSHSNSETLIVSIDGASLPTGSTLPEDIVTTVPSPRRTVAPPTKENSKTGDQVAQETKDANARNYKEYQIQKHAKTHDERVANCAAFATQRYPDSDSEEHKNWNGQCVKQVSAQEARMAR